MKDTTSRLRRSSHYYPSVFSIWIRRPAQKYSRKPWNSSFLELCIFVCGWHPLRGCDVWLFSQFTHVIGKQLLAAYEKYSQEDRSSRVDCFQVRYYNLCASNWFCQTSQRHTECVYEPMSVSKPIAFPLLWSIRFDIQKHVNIACYCSQPPTEIQFERTNRIRLDYIDICIHINIWRYSRKRI